MHLYYCCPFSSICTCPIVSFSVACETLILDTTSRGNHFFQAGKHQPGGSSPRTQRSAPTVKQDPRAIEDSTAAAAAFEIISNINVCDEKLSSLQHTTNRGDTTWRGCCATDHDAHNNERPLPAENSCKQEELRPEATHGNGDAFVASSATSEVEERPSTGGAWLSSSTQVPPGGGTAAVGVAGGSALRLEPAELEFRDSPLCIPSSAVVTLSNK